MNPTIMKPGDRVEMTELGFEHGYAVKPDRPVGEVVGVVGNCLAIRCGSNFEEPTLWHRDFWRKAGK
jgi:hypothetical protein